MLSKHFIHSKIFQSNEKLTSCGQKFTAHYIIMQKCRFEFGILVVAQLTDSFFQIMDSLMESRGGTLYLV